MEPTLAVILPTLNEVGNIEWLLNRFQILQRRLSNRDNYDEHPQGENSVKGHIPKHIHLVFVDDGSTDGTPEKLREITQSEEYPFESISVTLLSRTKKHGLGNAYKDAVSILTREKKLYPSLIAIMDADGSHDPTDIEFMVMKMLENKEKPLCVIGSRYSKGGGVDRWGVTRRILSLGANATTRVLLSLSGIPGTRIKFGKTNDTSDSFRVYDTSALRKALENVKSSGFSVQEECLFYLMREYPTRPVLEYPIFFRMRRKGESKCSIKEIILFAQAILELFLLH